MYVKVKVIVGTKKEVVMRESPDCYRISVREKAERNMANTRIREIIAGECGVLLGRVRIISGHHSPSKILSVENGT